jgi:hypothetical protein
MAHCPLPDIHYSYLQAQRPLTNPPSPPPPPNPRAVNGPTTAGGKLPPFEWRGKVAERVAHIGQPDRFDYRFELMTANEEAWGGEGAADFS